MKEKAPLTDIPKGKSEQELQNFETKNKKEIGGPPFDKEDFSYNASF
jgi:hypothetical protein